MPKKAQDFEQSFESDVETLLSEISAAASGDSEKSALLEAAARLGKKMRTAAETYFGSLKAAGVEGTDWDSGKGRVAAQIDPAKEAAVFDAFAEVSRHYAAFRRLGGPAEPRLIFNEALGDLFVSPRNPYGAGKGGNLYDWIWAGTGWIQPLTDWRYLQRLKLPPEATRLIRNRFERCIPAYFGIKWTGKARVPKSKMGGEAGEGYRGPPGATRFVDAFKKICDGPERANRKLRIAPISVAALRNLEENIADDELQAIYDMIPYDFGGEKHPDMPAPIPEYLLVRTALDAGPGAIPWHLEHAMSKALSKVGHLVVRNPEIERIFQSYEDKGIPIGRDKKMEILEWSKDDYIGIERVKTWFDLENETYRMKADEVRVKKALLDTSHFFLSGPPGDNSGTLREEAVKKKQDLLHPRSS